jgi:hypothetical protein
MEFPVNKKNIIFSENKASDKVSKLNRIDSLIQTKQDVTLFRYPAFTISKSARFLDLHSIPFNGHPPGIFL